MSIFEQATRQKLRFKTSKGVVSVEDLWDLHLTRGADSLNNLAKGLNKDLKTSQEEDFVAIATANTSVDKETKLKFDIIIHIINVKVEEANKAKDAAKIKQKKDKLLALKARKEDEQLESLSMEDIDAQLKDLES